MANDKTTMEIIREGLLVAHAPGEPDTTFTDAIYSLFKEFSKDYKDEWDRIDDNENIYRGKHWEGVSESLAESKSNFPKPATPIVTSTIENIKADLSDEYPEAIIIPDAAGNEVTAKVLTVVIRQEIDVCGFEREYDLTTQDFLNCGWSPWEVGYDPFLNNGLGGGYIRYVINKNFMCDPQCSALQDGRAVFKFDRKPKDWFLQHYPEHAAYMTGDEDLVDREHDDFDSTTKPSDAQYYRLIEAWFRVYDPVSKRHSVHMVKVAGHQVLENSHDEKPDGYYKHGRYPFVIPVLFPMKGSALGFGITDLFKDPQRYSDKLDQILLVNAYRASRPRLLAQKGLVDIEDFADFSNELIEVDGPPAAVAQWQETQPLPAWLLQYMQLTREMIKTESGSNEQSCGGATGGITAASAITALQEMSTKRSRLEARALNYAFRDAVRMLIDVLREFSIVPRSVAVTVNGKQTKKTFDRTSLSSMFSDGGELPIEYYIDIRSSRQTKYTKLTHNEMILQMMQTLAGTIDPVIMLEALEYDEKEAMLDTIRKAQHGGMMALQQENAQLQQTIQQMQQQMNSYQQAANQAQAIVDQDMLSLQNAQSGKSGHPSQAEKPPELSGASGMNPNDFAQQMQ